MLFDRYRLGEVTRLINIAVALYRNIICKKLHRDDGKRRGELVKALRQADNVLAYRLVTGEIVGGNENNGSAACYDLADVGNRLFKERRLRRQSDNECAVFNQ